MAVVSFNIYLVRTASESTVEKEMAGSSALTLDGLSDGRFRVLPTPANTPDWYTNMSPFLVAEDGAVLPAAPQSQSPGALFACKVDGRLFLVTFGVGHAYVKKSLVEAHFGRKVAMNSVPPSQVVEFQSRQVFAAFHRLSERAPGATRHKNFAVEGERDLVAAVEGLTSGVTALGRRVRGATALSIEIEAKELPKALAESLVLFAAPNKFVEWSEYDNLTPVVDEAEVLKLDGQLDSYLATKPQGLILAAPGDEDLATATSFHIGRPKKNQKPTFQPLLYAKSFYGALAETPSISGAKATPVYFYDSAQTQIEERSTVYDCICFEASVAGRSFVLWSGRWYEAQIDFVKRVRDRVAQLSPPKNPLVAWDKKVNEDVYNRVAGKVAGFKTLDRKLVYLGGKQSKFEHCDVLHASSKTLYFVKQYSASATMSHLVEQVRRTSELFFGRDPAYRSQMKKAKLDVPDKAPHNHEWTLCLVVMGRELKKLPLFAQCGIARLTRDLEQLQHEVAAQSV